MFVLPLCSAAEVPASLRMTQWPFPAPREKKPTSIAKQRPSCTTAVRCLRTNPTTRSVPFPLTRGMVWPRRGDTHGTTFASRLLRKLDACVQVLSSLSGLAIQHASPAHRLRLTPREVRSKYRDCGEQEQVCEVDAHLEVQQVVAVHEFMYWLGSSAADGSQPVGLCTAALNSFATSGNDAKKWHVGWQEMSGTARALLRSLQLWLVAGEYQTLDENMWGS